MADGADGQVQRQEDERRHEEDDQERCNDRDARLRAAWLLLGDRAYRKG